MNAGLKMRPLLAEGLDEKEPEKQLAELLKQGPLWVSRKLDGIRALKIGNQLFSRSLKPIRNNWTQGIFKCLPEGIDGELIVGDHFGEGVFKRTTSGVMSIAGQPKVRFFAFDNWQMRTEPFEVRQIWVHGVVKYIDSTLVVNWPSTLCEQVEDIMTEEQCALEEGYEGLMLRKPQSPYKWNRSTFNEGYLLKLKRYKDSEAEIIGFVQKYHNTNEARTDARGLTTRSSAKGGKVPFDPPQLGAFQVRDIHTQVEFEVYGFTFEEATRYWAKQSDYLGKIICYRYLPYGVKDKPRHPTFKGFRDKEDL